MLESIVPLRLPFSHVAFRVCVEYSIIYDFLLFKTSHGILQFFIVLIALLTMNHKLTRSMHQLTKAGVQILQ